MDTVLEMQQEGQNNMPHHLYIAPVLSSGQSQDFLFYQYNRAQQWKSHYQTDFFHWLYCELQSKV